MLTTTAAALWVDGRYHLQADAQTDDNWDVMKEGDSNLKILDAFNLFGHWIILKDIV